MTNLFNDTRDGKRSGFQQEISTALFHLLRLHDEINKTEEPQKKVLDQWDFRDVGINKSERKQ